RDAVPLPGHRLADLHRRARQGFPDARGRHPHHRHRLCGGHIDRRLPLFRAQSTHPARSRAMSATDTPATVPTPDTATRRGPWGEVLHSLLRSGTFLTGLGIVLFWIGCALFGEHCVPYDPLADDIINALSPPSAGHWFGTDQIGRDVCSRVIVASRG